MNDSLVDNAATRLARHAPPATLIRPDIGVSFEFFPPANEASSEALGRNAAQLAAYGPQFVSVTYGAGGSGQDKTFDALDQLTATADLPVAGHLTCVAASKETVQGVIDDYRQRGVTRIVALRGDAPADAPAEHPDGYETAAELVAGIRARHDGDHFDISVAAYPEVHPKATSAKADMDNLKRKLDAGADRAITQFFFDTDAYLRFLEDARAAGITAPIVPGIMPITKFAGICRFSERCNTSVPQWMRELFAGLDDKPEIRELVAATVAAEQCKRLMDHGVTDFHFYTMNKANLTAATCQILGVTSTPAASNKSASKAS